MKIENLGFNDYEKIRAFDRENFPNEFWEDEDWKSLLNDPECFYYAYIIDDKIAACVFIHENKEPPYIKIMNLAVGHEFRGSGLAVKLLNYITDKYSIKGYKTYYAETRESNIAMQKSFDKSGYTFRSLAENMYENPVENGIKYQLKIGE